MPADLARHLLKAIGLITIFVGILVTTAIVSSYVEPLVPSVPRNSLQPRSVLV